MIAIAIRLRSHDYDPTTTYRACLLQIRRKQKMNMSIFRRSRSRIVVESQSWYRLKSNATGISFVHTDMT